MTRQAIGESLGLCPNLGGMPTGRINHRMWSAMLPTNLAKQPRFNPFNLHRVQIIDCREYTMIDAAADLSGFKGYRKNFVLTYTYKQPDLDVLKGKEIRGDILLSLYFWR